MNTKKVHEQYHSKIKLQKRIISPSNFTYRNMLHILNKNLLGKNLKVLDVGSGVGTVDFYLADKGCVVFGIDISTKAVSAARQNSKIFGLKNLSFYVGNINKFKFNSKFDLILCSEIIEHVEDDDKLLKDLSKHLKKTGLLFLSTPLDSAPLNRFGLTKNFDKRVGHLRRYNLVVLQSLVRKNGLKIIKVEYKEGIFRNLLFVFNVFDPIVRVANKFPVISDFFAFLDSISLKIFGASNIYLVLKKK